LERERQLSYKDAWYASQAAAAKRQLDSIVQFRICVSAASFSGALTISLAIALLAVTFFGTDLIH